MKNLIFIVLLFYFIKNKVPEYTEIKKDEILSFKLDNYNSTFYAYLNCSNDYEPEENRFAFEHYLRLDKKIKYNYDYFSIESGFPDE